MPGLIAAGAVVWRRAPSGDVEVALVHRPHYDDWSLPKGKPHSGEALPFTAVREVGEETGHTIALGAKVGSTRYPVRWGQKVAHYWAARPTGGSFSPSAEVDELRWLPLAQATDLLTHQHDRKLLACLNGATAITSTVLLVRHGEAGERKAWHGDQDLRPLTVAGQRQAESLRALLPLFGAARVHSAPPVRCRQSVEGLAEDLGGSVIDEPRLSEESYLADPAGSLRRLIEIVGEPGGPAVICSQGGVIPDLVRTFTKQTRLDLADVPSHKGSFWGLFFGDDSATRPLLLAADYYNDVLG